MLQLVKTIRLAVPIVKVLIAAIVLFFVYQLPVFQSIDDRYNDYWRRHIAWSDSPDERILIIEIDEQSLTDLELQLGRWPWPRSVYGFMVEQLVQAKSQAVVFDILFSERDIYRDDFDQYFSESVHQKENVFYAATYLGAGIQEDSISFTNLPESFFVKIENPKLPAPTGRFVLPWILDVSDWNIGLINFLADTDGKARRYPVTTSIGNWEMHSLASRVASYVSANKLAKNTQKIDSLTEGQYQFPKIINLKYKDMHKGFNSIAFSDAKKLLENQRQLEIFRDKIVLFGATATGLHDLRATPIDPMYPGTSIIATAIDNLLNDDYLILIDRQYGFVTLMLLLFMLFGIIYRFENYRIQAFASLLLFTITVVSLCGISWGLSQYGRLFPAASIAILFAIGISLLFFYRGFIEYVQRRHAMQTFSRFMDPEVVRQLMVDQSWQKKLAHKSCQVSVLFSDIRGFTTLSEKRSAEQIMQILNDYFDLQVEAIFANKGTLDKFIGDAIMAFWGAPLEDEQHAARAVEAALCMVENLLDFRASLPVELRGFDVGIGVHSGPAVVGMLGSAKRFDYTAIGDTVNLASRIEGVTKGVARVLVSEHTAALCGEQFHFEYRGEFTVKGREEKVKLFEPSRSV